MNQVTCSLCASSNKSGIHNLKNKKTLDFWHLSFSTKLPKETFDILCSDSNKSSKLEASLTADLLNSIQNSTDDIGETYFKSLDKIIFCKKCSIEIKKSLLYDHINSKEHKDIEDYFISRGMNYCEICIGEIKNDEWREHILSEDHLERAGKKGLYDLLLLRTVVTIKIKNICHI